MDLVPFQDPIAEFPEGTEYNRDWLGSWASVQRRKADGRVDTGFRVIAVADRQGALEPSRSLGWQLARLGSLAALFFVLVSLGLLYFVFQSLRKGGEKATRILGATVDDITDGNGLPDMPTIVSSAGKNPPPERS